MEKQQVTVRELKDAQQFAESICTDRLQVVELYTAWAGPTAAAKTAWRKLAFDLGGGPLPFDLTTVCLDHVRDSAGGQPLAAFPLTSEPQWAMFKRGRQMAAVAGLDLPALVKAAHKHSMETVAVVRESEC